MNVKIRGGKAQCEDVVCMSVDAVFYAQSFAAIINLLPMVLMEWTVHDKLLMYYDRFY